MQPEWGGPQTPAQPGWGQYQQVPQQGPEPGWRPPGWQPPGGHTRMPNRRRRWLIAGVVTAAVLVTAVLVALFVIYPRVGEAAIREKVLPKLIDRVGHDVTIESVSVSLGSAALGNVVVTDVDGMVLARVPTVTLEFAVWPSFFGRVELAEVRVENPDLVTEIAKDGTTSWDALRASLTKRQEGGDGSDGGSGQKLTPDLLRVIGGSFEVRDLARQVTSVGDGLEVTLRRSEVVVRTKSLSIFTAAGPKASLTDVVIMGRPKELSETAEITLGGGELTLSDRVRLTGVTGKIAPASQKSQLWIDLAGGWDGSSGQVWKAVGHFDPRTKHGDLKIAAERFALDRIAEVLEETPLRNVEKTFLGGELKISADGKTLKASGNISVEGLSVYHRRLAAEPITDVNFSGDLSAEYDLASRTLTLEGARMLSGGVEYQLEALVKRGIETPIDELHAKLHIPPVDCQTVLDSLPNGLVPKLRGFEVAGTFSTDVELGISWAALEDTVLDGSVGIYDCKVVRAADGMSASKLRGQFRHRVIVRYDKGNKPVYRTITVGPSSSAFMSVSRVSKHLVNSILTTEDSAFFRHRGFIVPEFRTALIKNLKAGYFRYGASSITMQLVKNVYFGREKTMSRKLQELFMTWYVETEIKKERLMEVYLNAIEYGPSLYGIGPASRRLFNKSATDLNPTESAFMASLLPAPRRRFRQYCRDEMSSWTEGKIERILGLMKKRGRLTDEEYDQAMSTPLLFRLDKTGCGRR